jgi:hypothetical protein
MMNKGYKRQDSIRCSCQAGWFGTYSRKSYLRQFTAQPADKNVMPDKFLYETNKTNSVITAVPVRQPNIVKHLQSDKALTILKYTQASPILENRSGSTTK